MNDWWNDPPDPGPEMPACPRCKDDGELLEFRQPAHLICPTCGYETMISEYFPDYGTENEPTETEIEESQEKIAAVLGVDEKTGKCRHGNPWENCPTCDYESDIAFDAWRERRMK